MELRTLIDDDDAVSPVIGVILMVAITVILAAVIATFVLGLGEQVSQTAPQASFSFDYEDGTTSATCGGGSDGDLTVTHNGGKTIEAGRLKVTGATGGAVEFTCDSYSDSSEIDAGDQISLTINNDDDIDVVWTSQDGGQSATLSQWSAPNA